MVALLGQRERPASPVPVGRRTLPDDLGLFVDLKAAELEVLDHTSGELVAGVIGHMLLRQSPQQVTVLPDGETDGEDEQVTKRVVIHGRMFS